MSVQVVTLSRERIVYPFSNQDPYVRIGTPRYGHQVPVDPTPAYGHDHALTLRTLERVAQLFPIDWPVAIWLLPAECLSRTNGATHVQAQYDYNAPLVNGQYPLLGTFGDIYLSAKRIPIHPAMTRYLVAHEYGHVVEEWLNKQREKSELHSGSLLKEYAEMRGLTFPDSHGAGVWHLTPGEVFANDFRLLVCDVEPEFWPHHGIERPEGLPAVHAFWHDQVKRIQAAQQGQAA